MLAVVIVVMAGTADWIWSQRSTARAVAERNVASIARVLADHVGRSVQAMDQMLLHVAYELGTDGAAAAWRRAALHRRLAGLNQSAPQIRNLSVFDAAGNLVGDSHSASPRRINVADRAYFREMQADPEQRLRLVGPFQNRVNGLWTVGFLRPISAPDGRPLGLVFASFDPSYYRTVFGAVGEWGDSDFVLLGPGGTPLLRHPSEPDAAGSFASGGEAIVVRQIVAGYPLVMAVRRSVEGALDPWRRQSWTVGIAATLLCLLLLLSTLSLTRRLDAGAERERALRDSERRWREMVDGSGLAIQISDDDGNRLYGNPAFIRMAGVDTVEGLMALPRLSFVAPADRERVHRLHTALVAGAPGPMIYEFTGVRKDGATLPVQAILQRVTFDGCPAVQRTFIDLTALKRAERSLEGERDLASKVVDIAPVIIAILDRDGRIEHVNPYFEQVTGVSLDEARGRNCYDSFLPEPDGARLRRALDPSNAGRPTGGTVARVLTADGSECDVLWFGRTMTDDRGRPTGLLAIGQNVTDAVRAERALAERERSLANAQRIGHMGNWERNLVTGEVRWSEQVYRLLGRDPQTFEASLDNIVLATHPEDREKVGSAIADALAAHASSFGYHARIVLPGGELRMIEQYAELAYADDGTPLRASGIMRDVTKRLRTEEALRRSEIRFRSIMENIHDSIVLIDEKGTIETANPAALKAFGYEEADLRGRNVSVLMPEPFRSAHDGYLRTYLETGRANILGRGPREVTGLTRDGREIPLELGIREMALGERRLFIGTLRDISDRKLVEAQLRQAQKMEAVGQLTGGVAHDFNNLLAVISGNLEMLQEKLDDRPALRTMADTALRSVRRGAELTQSLLSYARRQPLAEAVVDLNLVVGETADLMRRMLTEAVDLRTVPASGLWPCRTDSTLLQTALINLAVNARDAMPEGGQLTIGTANCTVAPAEAAAVPDLEPGDYATIAVSDNGVGMPREVVEKVFEPFFTTKDVGKGTGLGLSMVYGFVKQSRGHVRVTSAPGEGTTVTLYLPRDAGDPARRDGTPPARPSGTPDPGARGSRILVVEDDADIRALAVTILAARGYAVAAADGMEPALALLRDDGRFDLLLTDIILRGRGSGDELADEARALVPGLRVLFMSGHAETLVHRDDRTVKDIMLLKKPFHIKELIDAVRRALGTGAGEDRSWVAAS
jgi:PAS domain S-box-containing protein